MVMHGRGRREEKLLGNGEAAAAVALAALGHDGTDPAALRIDDTGTWDDDPLVRRDRAGALPPGFGFGAGSVDGDVGGQEPDEENGYGNQANR